MKRMPLALFFLSFLCSVHSAERFKISSEVDSVRISGYYKIQLSHDIISFSGTSYADIRLLNAKGEEIPFIFLEEKPMTAATGFKDYPVIENKYMEKKKLSRIAIHNGNKNVISDLVLIIRNSSIKKEFVLKGSNDKKTWFAIWKGYPQHNGNFNETTQTFTINFPKSDYEFFEIMALEPLNHPLEITRVGHYCSKVVEGIYSEVPVKSIFQKDSSDKKSYISVVFERPYEFSKMQTEISGASFYKRNMLLGHFSKQNQKTTVEALQSFELSSTRPPSWPTGKLKLQELVLVIDNMDNSPLKIEKVKFYQLNKYLIAKLEKGEKYYIKSGNLNVAAPEYDLKYFSDSIPDALPTLQVNKMNIVIDEPAEPAVYFTKTVLWIVVSIVVLLLGYYTIRMIKEMK